MFYHKITDIFACFESKPKKQAFSLSHINHTQKITQKWVIGLNVKAETIQKS